MTSDSKDLIQKQMPEMDFSVLRKLKRLSQNMHFYRSPTHFHKEVSRRSAPEFPKFYFRSSSSLTQYGHLVRCERVDSSPPSPETLLQQIRSRILTSTFMWFYFKSKFKRQPGFQVIFFEGWGNE